MRQLTKWVTYKTQNQLGMHDWSSEYIYCDGNVRTDVYVGNLRFGNSLVIVEVTREYADRNRIDWYIGTVNKSPPWGSHNQPSRDEFFGAIPAVIKRKNRVAGRNIETVIIKLLDDDRSGTPFHK